jgi:hypothetical protein
MTKTRGVAEAALGMLDVGGVSIGTGRAWDVFTRVLAGKGSWPELLK